MDASAIVQQFIEEQALLQPGETVVLAVSGGPDSLCALDLLHRLAPHWQMALHVAHLNHSLRPEAAAEVEVVRREAAQRGLPFHTATADVRARAHQHKQSLEEAGRDARYTFFAQVAQHVHASAILIAHTADDQAETVLMHFLRGAGVAGLRGMLPSTPSATARIIRPLLCLTRAEVEAYCAAHQLQPLIDPTNADPAFFRNRLRHQLLPELQTYNPNIRAVLGRTATVLAGDYEVLRAYLDELWATLAQADESQVAFDRARWLALPLATQRALLREAVAHLRPTRRDVDFIPIERAARFAQTAAPGRQCDVLAGLCLRVEAQRFVLSDWQTAAPTSNGPRVATAGHLSPGWSFHMRACAEWSAAEVENNVATWRVWVDAALITEPLQVRARVPGDWFCPLGLAGHRVKLSDFMINAKVPQAWRAQWPVVVCGAQVVWLAGLRLDERFKVTPATTRVVELWFEENPHD